MNKGSAEGQCQEGMVKGGYKCQGAMTKGDISAEEQ